MNILSSSIGEAVTETVTEGLSSLFTLAFYALLIRILMIVGVVALITWVVKKVWNAGNNRNPKVHKPKAYNQWTDDWVYNASARQNNRYEYSDPIKPKKGWVYNERARMWVDGDQFDQEQHQRAYEENRRKWKAYKAEEDAKEAERWEEIETKRQIERHQREVLQEMNRPVYLTEEEKELAKKIRVERKEPTFEEWKAEQLKKSPDGVYRRDYVHIEQDDSVPKV